LIGDIIKLLFFIFDHSPNALKLCAIIQVSVDVGIIGQMFFYRRRNGLPATCLARVESSLRKPLKTQARTPPHENENEKLEIIPLENLGKTDGC
jgi:hypothetical protein